MEATSSLQVEQTENRRFLLDNERFLGMAMLLPAAIYILLLVGIPFIFAILYSFSDATIGNPQLDGFTLETFRRVLSDPTFQRSLGNNFLFTALSQVITVVLANILALALTRSFPGKWFVRLLILLPWATPIAIGTVGWLWMLDSVYSPIDWILRNTGFLGPGGLLKRTPNMYWLAEPGLAMFSIVMVHVWRMLPMSTVIIMAGLSSISPDIRDAVQVDGVGFWREWREVTLPLLRPILLVALLFGIIFTFTDMTVVYVLTRGGPNNATQVLASWAYFKGIDSGNLAEGAATVIFMLPVLLGVAIILLRIARRSEVL
ncbi:MAG TPA: sugar ABC transporter permease [Oceanobacillus sp.]|nr:sugar ABC transporter permease [Oceanobacillus sp.]